ncbi:hypothetical protein HAZT_HAZT004321 [Hyalella azteca]|uniref:Uncharacterized protein n=1 Tax=Hyalella azteca TaxID=294128 RepID=A0A6A0H0T5_HYAAZ|nr:hypothetical protein HAZT_HAZT004321 [Hyalella azteca]
MGVGWVQYRRWTGALWVLYTLTVEGTHRTQVDPLVGAARPNTQRAAFSRAVDAVLLGGRLYWTAVGGEVFSEELNGGTYYHNRWVFRPCGVHVASTTGECGVHVASTTGECGVHVASTTGECGVHVASTSGECGVHVASTTGECGVHVASTTGECGVHVASTSGECGVHVASTIGGGGRPLPPPGGRHTLININVSQCTKSYALLGEHPGPMVAVGAATQQEPAPFTAPRHLNVLVTTTTAAASWAPPPASPPPFRGQRPTLSLRSIS